MIGQDYRKPYVELPVPWTIGRVGRLLRKDVFVGYNRNTGEETPPYATYDEALAEVLRRSNRGVA